MRPRLGFSFKKQNMTLSMAITSNVNFFDKTDNCFDHRSPQYSILSISSSPGGRRCFYRYPLTSLLFETLPKFRQTENKLLQLYTNRSYHPCRHFAPFPTTLPRKTVLPQSRLSLMHSERLSRHGGSVAKKGHCQKVFAVRGRLFFFRFVALLLLLLLLLEKCIERCFLKVFTNQKPFNFILTKRCLVFLFNAENEPTISN